MSDFRKIHDLIKFRVDLRAAHSKNRAVHVDVFTPRQFGMKSRANFEKGANPSAHADSSRRRFGDTGENLEQGAFASAVAPDNAEDSAFLQIEGDVLQRPDKILIHASVRLSDHRLRQTKGRVDCVHDHVAQHVITELRLRRADFILLADVVY